MQVDFRIIVTANLRDPNVGDDDADIQIGSNFWYLVGPNLIYRH